jgi:hypothetical protein
MPFVPALDFDYAVYDTVRYLRVGTHGRSMFQTALPAIRGPRMSASPMKVAFSCIEAGVGSDTANVSLLNFGSDTLVVSSISLDNPEFKLSGVPGMPLAVPSGETFTFGVSYHPSDHGWDTTRISIASNDTVSAPAPTTVTGKGVTIGRAQAGVLYAAGGGELIELGTESAAVSLIGELGVTELNGLTVRPTSGEIYGFLKEGSDRTLYRVSSPYGDALEVTDIPLPALEAIAFSDADVLYGATRTGELFAIDPLTGDTTAIGKSSPALIYSSLAFNPVSGKLWASVAPIGGNRDKLYTVDTQSGQAALVGSVGDNAVTPAIAFDGSGNLFALKGFSVQTNTLLSIDTASGAGTLIGSTGVSGLRSLTMRSDTVLVSVDEKADGLVPAVYSLSQSYPNPFNPTTTIRYGLPEKSHVTLKVYNVLGEEVETLVDEVQGADFRAATFDATGMASGVYLYRLRAGSFVSTKKMLLLR